MLNLCICRCFKCKNLMHISSLSEIICFFHWCYLNGVFFNVVKCLFLETGKLYSKVDYPPFAFVRITSLN